MGDGLEEVMIRKIRIRQAVHSLPENEKAVVALRAAGFTQKDCGILLGVTRAAVGFMQKRANAKIKSLLDKEFSYVQHAT